VSDIRKRLKRTTRNFKPEASKDPLAAARGMLAKINRSQAPISEVLLHQYRILTKRARYAAEFAAQSAEAEQFIAGVKRVQDALGDWHDWLTLMQTASAQLGEVRDSPLVAELHNVTGAKFRRAVAALSHMRGAGGITKPMAEAPAPVQAAAKPRTSITAA